MLVRRQVRVHKQKRRSTAPALAPVPAAGPVDPDAEERGLRALVVEDVADAAGHLADVQRGEVRDQGFPVCGVVIMIGCTVSVA